MINYPKYIRNTGMEKSFRHAVLHRVMAEKNPNHRRACRHHYLSGWWSGILRGYKDTMFIETMSDDIYNEAKRIYLLVDGA